MLNPFIKKTTTKTCSLRLLHYAVLHGWSLLQSFPDILTTPHHSSKLLVPGSLATFPVQGCHYSRDFSIYGNDLSEPSPSQFLDLLVILNNRSLLYLSLPCTFWTLSSLIHSTSQITLIQALEQRQLVHHTCWHNYLQLFFTLTDPCPVVLSPRPSDLSFSSFFLFFLSPNLAQSPIISKTHIFLSCSLLFCSKGKPCSPLTPVVCIIHAVHQWSSAVEVQQQGRLLIPL